MLGVGAVVLVAIGDDLATMRVVDLDASRFALAAPEPVAFTTPAVVGGTLQLMWSVERGQYSVDARLSEVAETDPPLWWVVPQGEPVIQQRRSFVRVPVVLNANLEPTGEVVDEPRFAVVVDLSEGGARVRLDGDTLEPGTPVRLRFQVDGRGFDVDGYVIRSLPAEDSTMNEHAVEFRQPVVVADDLRRYIFSEQIKQRRLMR